MYYEELKETKLQELDKIVREYPNEIPLKSAAEFLHMKVETLRKSIANGNFKAGVWYKTTGGRTEYFLSTVPFINWYTGR